MYRSVIQKISDNVNAYPDHIVIAAQGEGNLFTYREFDAYARKVAARLKHFNVNHGDFVTIELPRNKEYIAAIYAAWLSGAAFVPLSPEYPVERLEFIRSDCNAKAVINEEFLIGIEDETPFEEMIFPEASALSMLIYTSGSTGKPKGVLHSHASLADAVERFAEYFELSKIKRTAVGAPFTFIASTQFFLMPLCYCLTTFIIPYEAMRDPILLADYLCDNQINFTFISPKMLKVLSLKDSSLNYVMTGSERVSNIYSAQYTVLVGYGQTETAGGTLIFELDKKYENSPIGKTIGNIRAYILDENGLEADEGELCLAGIFADGYLNLPEQTAKTFTENPFKEKDGFDKLLHTGDIVRREEDGNMIFLNRRDWMVKINGQRVEPGEIEAVLKNTDGIFDAAIKDFKNNYGQVYLVAYYVDNKQLDAEELKAAITEKLPSYMVPTFFVRLDQLPVNRNGKLDRNALTAPETGEFKNEYIAPVTETQKALCSAFEKVLEVENVGIDDDFFALGGDSIKSTLVLQECNGCPLSIADIMEGKTPRIIERIIHNRKSKEQILKKENKSSVYPLTSSERGMYFEQKLDESSTVYNLNIAVTVKGTELETVKKVLYQIFAAHESFHSYYGEENGIPVRILSDKLPEIIVKQAETHEEVIDIIDNYAQPFDLSDGIPVRPTLYITADGSIILHMAIHHIAFDGGSAAPFVNELIDGLNGKEIKAAKPDLSDLYSTDNDNESGMAYYREMFQDGVPVNEMPIRSKRPKVHPISDKEVKFDYDNTQLKAINKTARKFGVSEFELIFSAVSMVLGKYTASQDVVLGIPTNMRPNGADNVIGMFVNTVPVRVKPVRSAAVTDYVQMVSKSVRSATYGMSLPFEDIITEFVKQRDDSRNPVFDVSVNYMWYSPKYEKDGLSVEMYVPLQKMSRDISIVIRRNENSLCFTAQYSSELFEDIVIENFVTQLQHTLHLVSDSTAKTVGDALALPENQLKKLENFSTEAFANIPIVLLHKLFEQTVAENADKTALIAKDKTLSYRELNESANIVAHNLIEKGVRTGDRVALLLPRQSCFFSCLFGVNKAGAVFIPCDPQYPADRIRNIVGDSGALFIITTKDKLEDYSADKVIDAEELLDGSETDNLNLEMSGDELSYMIYTSGSTGKPKGVMLKHKGICNYLLPHYANLHMHFLKNNISNYLSVTTVSFDMSFKEHTAALCNGKTLIFAAEDEMNDPRALAGLMEKYNVDCINATPSRLQQYIEYKPFKEQLAKCKLVMSGGESYPISLRNAIKDCCENIKIVNTYGPTEITVSCNACDITNAEHISIGRPLLNYSEYIVDTDFNVVPQGVTGELLIGGVGVAEGYRNLPEQTAKSFIEYNGERVYRSGDYAKWDEDGNVVILGRMDTQIKLRGLRIELGEIVGLMEQQPHILRAAAAVRKISGRDNLCAWFTADTQINLTELRNALAEKLTNYMVPSAMMQVDKIPVTPNGKTSVKALPSPEMLESGEYVAPVNEVEEFFCELFQKVLKLDKVGVNDDFFSIGGTSLAVTSVMVGATENGYELTYGDVFRYTTPHELAAKFMGEGDTKSLSAAQFDRYDYSKINDILSRNTLDAFRNGEKRDIGNILLTGATGYMGIHILAEFLQSYSGTVYCMVRKGRYDSALSRVKNMLFYYFGKQFNNIGDRLQAFDGDVTDYEAFRQFLDLQIDTVFNCAASVKHFSSGTDIEDINVGGVQNCIRFCLEKGARLIHFSTISVGGAIPANAENKTLDERSLYFGQILENQYTSSKLLAERKVFENVAENGLDAKVIRVGTLAPRESDGEFQVNFLSNSFMGRLRVYAMLKFFPYSLMNNIVRMGPIDESAKAFMLLSQTPHECCLFNAVNTHAIPLLDVIRTMNEQGINIEISEDAKFYKEIEKAEQDSDKAAILQSMLAYKNMNDKNVVPAGLSFDYTSQLLARMGFCWNATDSDYIRRFIKALIGLSFFDENNLLR